MEKPSLLNCRNGSLTCVDRVTSPKANWVNSILMSLFLIYSIEATVFPNNLTELKTVYMPRWLKMLVIVFTFPRYIFIFTKWGRKSLALLLYMVCSTISGLVWFWVATTWTDGADDRRTNVWQHVGRILEFLEIGGWDWRLRYRFMIDFNGLVFCYTLQVGLIIILVLVCFQFLSWDGEELGAMDLVIDWILTV